MSMMELCISIIASWHGCTAQQEVVPFLSWGRGLWYIGEIGGKNSKHILGHNSAAKQATETRIAPSESLRQDLSIGRGPGPIRLQNKWVIWVQKSGEVEKIQVEHILGHNSGPWAPTEVRIGPWETTDHEKYQGSGPSAWGGQKRVVFRVWRKFIFFWKNLNFLWTLKTTVFWTPLALGPLPWDITWSVVSRGSILTSAGAHGPELWPKMCSTWIFFTYIHLWTLITHVF